MYTDILNILLAFFEGFALILSPCILPILPIVLSGSLTGDKRRPLGIIAGFIVSFTVVTLFIRLLTQAAHINPDVLRNISLLLLLILGFTMISTYLSERFALLTQRLMSVGSDSSSTQQTGFWSGFGFGILIGIIWTPCAGPILAAVIVQVVLQQTTLTSMLSVLMFAIGAAIPMLLIALLGRRIVFGVNFFKRHTDLIRKLLGVIIILSVILLYFNPTFGVSTSSTSLTPIATLSGNKLVNPVLIPYTAPKIEGIDAWINSPPLTLESLRGKVVLIDFWTYSCINCIRTLPYIKGWYTKYHQKGLEIIGIHSPEFEFEHDLTNVQEAVKKFGIFYPVALDNNFVTWRNFQNHFWPAHYLIDQQGKVVYVHYGEGEYDVTENNIRYLLGLNAEKAAEVVTKTNPFQTPETYLGFARSQRFKSVEGVIKNQITNFHFPTSLDRDEWALQGGWEIQSERIIAIEADAKLMLRFNAAHVYAVMGVVDVPVKISVQYETKLTGLQPAIDIDVTKYQLYELAQFSTPTEGTLTITALHPGLQIYTFTFG